MALNRSLESFSPGVRVRWAWGPHTAEGVVRKVFADRVERTINGKHVVRNAEPDCPAYLIEQDDGARVLKKHSEVSLA